MNYKISKAAASLSPSLTLAIDAKAKAMKAAGEDVVGFGAGEPDSTPRNTSRTPPPRRSPTGSPNTRQQRHSPIAPGHCRQIQTRERSDLPASQIIVSCGGKHSCYNTILATCEAGGNKVIIPAPSG